MKTFHIYFTCDNGFEASAIFQADSEEHAEELFREDFGSLTIDSIERVYDDYDDSMDGDAESALASAGWGSDEDYGYADEVL